MFCIWILCHLAISLCAQEKFNTVVYYSSPKEIAVEFHNLSNEDFVILLDRGSYAYFYKNDSQLKSGNLPRYEFEATDSMNVLIRIPPRQMYIGKYNVSCCLLKSYIEFLYFFDSESSILDYYWKKYSGKLMILPFGSHRASTTNVKQVKKESLVGDPVYSKPEIEAEFPGGREAFNRYLADKTFKYCSDILGIIRVRIMIEKDGSVSHPYLVRSGGFGGRNFFFEKAVFEILKQMPKWKPASIGGKPVRSFSTFNIIFKMQ